MNSWRDPEARRKAVKAFVEYLNKSENASDRARCRTDRPFAKDLFARLGDFLKEEDAKPGDTVVPIPKETEFRVYEESDPNTRDRELATIVLPADREVKMVKGAKPTDIDVSQVYRCTWDAWVS